MHTLFFFMTKPRLSQAEALLLPKDFVSLNISKVTAGHLVPADFQLFII